MHRMSGRFLPLIHAAWATYAAALIVCLPPPSEARGSEVSATPAAILADWSKGAWQSAAKSNFISGYPSEDAYEDPKVEWTNPPPLTPKYLALYKKVRQAAFEGRSTLDQGANCSPLGIPFMAGWGLMEILLKPGQIAMVYEEEGGVRRIFTDGRPHPTGDDLIPSYNGHSIAHWEGKTLVVDTVGLRDDTYIEVGMAHSGKLHVIERWTQVGPDELRNTVTLIDPVAFTKPWGATWYWKRHADWTLNEVFCTASREVKINGATTMMGPDGKPLLGPAQKTADPPPAPSQK